VAADRHLLFGLLALQNRVINQAQLVLGFQAWTRDKSRSLAAHMETRGDLTAARRALLEGLVEVHLGAHGGQVEKSLASVSAAKSTRESLANLGDPGLEGTLAYVPCGQGSTDDGQTDSNRTSSYAVSSAASEGQRFRVLRPHARGGRGAVIVALDSQLDREVALKQILDHHADDPVSRQRFTLHAQVTGGLEHPCVVPVYVLGNCADGRPPGDGLARTVPVARTALGAAEPDRGCRAGRLGAGRPGGHRCSACRADTGGCRPAGCNPRSEDRQ
jgi:hypothetical protein